MDDDDEAHSRMLNVQEGKNRSSVVRDRHVSDVVHKHLVQTASTEAPISHLARYTSRRAVAGIHPTGPSDDFKMFDTV